MAVSKQHSDIPIQANKKYWVAQAMKEIVFLALEKSESILGLMEEE